MRKLIASLIFLALASNLEAAVAYQTQVSRVSGTGTTLTSNSITPAGTNRVVIVGLSINSTTITTTGISIVTGGTFQHVGAGVRNLTSYSDIWCVPNPTTGATTVTATFSASVDAQLTVAAFDGADQTTPCDTLTSDTTAGNGPRTVTPSGLGTGDATFAVGSLTVTGDTSAVTPNQLSLDASTNVNTETGYATNTTGVTFAWANSPTTLAMAAVRIHQVGGGGGTFIPNSLTLSGVGR